MADSFEEVAPNKVEVLLGEERPPFLLDVREPWEWAVSNLSDYGARLIPLGELGDRISEIPTDRPVVVYCRSGQRSRTGARRLLDAGRREVRSMRGGLQGWSEQVDHTMRVI